MRGGEREKPGVISSAESNMADVRMWNVLVMGFAFMFVFTAFQTTSIIEPTVLQSLKKERNSTNSSESTPDGYISLGIIYSVFTCANWLAPSFVSVCGPRASMLVGGICYVLFIASLIEPIAWVLYLASVIVGLGASIIWIGQGNFLTLNSNQTTITRNSGIFWAMLQCSLLFGNLFVYFELKGSDTIDNITRRKLYIVFTVICGLGVCLFFLLRKIPEQVPYREIPDDSFDQHIGTSEITPEKRSAKESLKASLKLFVTREMLLLSVCFAYTGLELTFFSGVYGTCVGNTIKLSKEPKRQIGIVGMLIGVGEILGGLVFGILGKRTIRFGREPIVFFGMIVHWVTFVLIYLNLPSDSPTKSTGGVAFFSSPSLYVAYLCGFLLGLGDSSYNTQIYSILGSLYKKDSAPAFAIFKFMQSLTAAIAFFYSLKLILEWQLLILVVSSFFGTLSFFSVEWTQRRHINYSPIS